jgi:hypothetical protein
MSQFISTSGVWTPDLTAAAPTVSIRLQGAVQATITAMVSNVGTRGAAEIAVRFLVDGVPLGSDRTLASLRSGESAVVASATWIPQRDGTHVVQVVVDPANAIAESNEANNSNSTSTLVDMTPPAGALTLSPNTLWPPNGKLVTITQTLSVADNLSEPVIVSGPVVSSNEQPSGSGEGPDWVVSGDTLQLRAERLGKGTGRVYTVTYALTDQAGNTSRVSATVTVPHDQR